MTGACLHIVGVLNPFKQEAVCPPFGLMALSDAP